MSAPFYMVTALSACWAVVLGAYYVLRMRGRCGSSFAETEAHLLAARRRKDGVTATAANAQRAACYASSHTSD